MAEADGGRRPAGKRKRRRRRRGGKGGTEPCAAPRRRRGARLPPRSRAPRLRSCGEAAAEPAAAEEPEARPKSRRRSRGGRGGARAAATRRRRRRPSREPSPFGELIDLGEEPASEIVEVPESRRPAAPDARAGAQAGDRGAGRGGLAPTIEADAVAAPAEPERCAPEAGRGPEPDGDAERGRSKADDGPKRRGWWSRAISGS